MREFVLIATEGITSPHFQLNDLPGHAGRMDLVARCVNSALWLSDTLRRDTKIHVLLEGRPNPPMMVSFDGKKLRGVSPDERNIAAWIRKALEWWLSAEENPGKWFDVQSGIKVGKIGLKEFLEGVDGDLFILDKRGKDIRKKRGFPGRSIFFIGDHRGIPQKYKRLIRRYGAETISVGPKVYLSSHVISYVNIEMDRRSQSK